MSNPRDPRPQLIALAQRFHSRGWMPGTSGLLSCRQADGSVEVSAPGRTKDQLREDDFITLAMDGRVMRQVRPQDRPSADSIIHLALYERFPQARLIVQLHMIEAPLVARMCLEDELLLPNLELLKGFGVWEQAPEVTVPVFENHLDVPRIAGEIRARMAASPPRVPGLLIRDQGLTVWGPTVAAVCNHVELFEYLFRYMVTARMAGLD